MGCGCWTGRVQWAFRTLVENSCLLWLKTTLMRAVRASQNSKVAAIKTKQWSDRCYKAPQSWEELQSPVITLCGFSLWAECFTYTKSQIHWYYKNTNITTLITTEGHFRSALLSVMAQDKIIMAIWLLFCQTLFLSCYHVPTSQQLPWWEQLNHWHQNELKHSNPVCVEGQNLLKLFIHACFRPQSLFPVRHLQTYTH